MDTEFIEIPPRVIRFTADPGREVPGHCRRAITITVESGPPLEFANQAELNDWTARLVAELVGGGVDVVSWGVDLAPG